MENAFSLLFFLLPSPSPSFLPSVVPSRNGFHRHMQPERERKGRGIHLPINSMTNFCLVQAEHESRRHINHHDHPGTIGIQLR